mmetsp:Transcript_14187/g.32163  ORF Transcript_14187/g.32163 Transcript_14187/m.32163 type:complete len:244 (-) Transcript_14187:9-740(-)
MRSPGRHIPAAAWDPAGSTVAVEVSARSRLGPEDGRPRRRVGNLSEDQVAPLNRLGVESVASFDSCTCPSHALLLPWDRPGRLGGAAVLLRSIGDDVHTAGAGRKARTGDARGPTGSGTRPPGCGRGEEAGTRWAAREHVRTGEDVCTSVFSVTKDDGPGQDDALRGEGQVPPCLDDEGNGPRWSPSLSDSLARPTRCLPSGRKYSGRRQRSVSFSTSDGNADAADLRILLRCRSSITSVRSF